MSQEPSKELQAWMAKWCFERYDDGAGWPRCKPLEADPNCPTDLLYPRPGEAKHVECTHDGRPDCPALKEMPRQEAGK